MQINVSWAILIIAGCFEAGFAFCLGKNERSRRHYRMVAMGGRIHYMPHNKHGLACKSHTCAAHKHGIPCMDRYRSGTDGHPRNIGIPRTGLVCKDIFHLHTDSFSHRAQNGGVIKKLYSFPLFCPCLFQKLLEIP